MQPKSRAVQHGLEINGIEYKGLGELSLLKSAKGEIDAAYPGGSETISNGSKKWEPIEGFYHDRADSNIFEVLERLYEKNEIVDLTYIERDAHGTEVRRWLIPEAENVLMEKTPLSADSPESNKIKFRFVFDSAIRQ